MQSFFFFLYSYLERDGTVHVDNANNNALSPPPSFKTLNGVGLIRLSNSEFLIFGSDCSIKLGTISKRNNPTSTFKEEDCLNVVDYTMNNIMNNEPNNNIIILNVVPITDCQILLHMSNGFLKLVNLKDMSIMGSEFDPGINNTICSIGVESSTARHDSLKRLFVGNNAGRAAVFTLVREGNSSSINSNEVYYNFSKLDNHRIVFTCHRLKNYNGDDKFFPVTSGTFASRGLLTTGGDGTLVCWDLGHKKTIWKLNGETGLPMPITQCKVLDDNNLMLICCNEDPLVHITQPELARRGRVFIRGLPKELL